MSRGYNRNFTWLRRSTEASTSGAADPTYTAIRSNFSGSLQRENPHRPSEGLTGYAVSTVFHIFTEENLSECQKEDVIRDEGDKRQYAVMHVEDLAGMGRVWKIYSERMS